MSNQNNNGEGLTNSNGTVSMVRTGRAALCRHLSALGEAVRDADSAIHEQLQAAELRIYRRDDPHAPEKRSCLKEADKIINGERQDSYGAPEDSFPIIAGYWNVFLAAKLKALGIDVKDLLSPLDTTNMMVLFKQARKLGQRPSRDNYVDSCGYEAIGADRLSE